MPIQLSIDQDCTLLVPVQLPLWIRNDPAFLDGSAWNYWSEEEAEEEEWTVASLLNHLYSSLRGDLYGELEPVLGKIAPDFCPWEVGWLLRDLTRLRETDRTLALVGLAHLCFLLSFLPSDPPSGWPPDGLIRARWLHDEALKAYRARVRGYREQSSCLAEAQRLAVGESERGSAEASPPIC